METRTRLTTPPGEQPAPTPSARSGSSSAGGAEHYVPGLAIPEEPRVPSRYRRLVIVTAVVVLVLTMAWIALQVATAGEDFDPAVDDPGAPAPAQLPDGGEGDTTG